MFGKKSSMNANEKFVMAMGQKAGNLPKYAKPKATTGKAAKPEKANPIKKPPLTKPAPNGNLSMNSKAGVQVNQNRPQSPGKVGTFATAPKRA